MKRHCSYCLLASATLMVVLGQRPSMAAETPAPGTIVTVAGIGKAGHSGDGGPALQATINAVHGLMFDNAQRLYLMDATLNWVRRIGLDGVITTVAGQGTTRSAGDNGPATNAALWLPADAVVDSAGNVYIAEFYSHRVRKIAPDGIITTFAGTGKQGDTGDNGPAAEARINAPAGLGMDAADNLYIAEGYISGGGGHRIRKVAVDGTITTVAGTGKAGFSGDGGPAIAARLNNPEQVIVAPDGIIYIVDVFNACVRKIDENGIISTIAGGGTKSPAAAEGGPAREVAFNFPHGAALDTAGNLFIGDMLAHRVFKVAPDGILSTVAGSGPDGVTKLPYSGEGGPATSAKLVGPWRVAIDAEGNLFIAESVVYLNSGPQGNERILKVVGVAAPGFISGRPFPKTQQ